MIKFNMLRKILLPLSITAFILLSAGCDEKDLNDDSSAAVIPTTPVNSYKTAGWYGKTKVSMNANGTVYTHNTAGVFGELVQSSEAKDQHDIPGYGDATFQIVFPQTEWGDDNGDYFSNYQNYEVDTKKVWTFQLKAAGTSSFPITIDLDNIYDVTYIEVNNRVEYKESQDNNQTILDALHLVDVDKQTEYTIGELKTANLTMDGKAIRTFRWVLGAVDGTDYTPLPSAQRSASRATQKTFQAPSASEGGGKFGLPPQ